MDMQAASTFTVWNSVDVFLLHSSVQYQYCSLQPLILIEKWMSTLKACPRFPIRPKFADGWTDKKSSPHQNKKRPKRLFDTSENPRYLAHPTMVTPGAVAWKQIGKLLLSNLIYVFFETCADLTIIYSFQSSLLNIAFDLSHSITGTLNSKQYRYEYVTIIVCVSSAFLCGSLSPFKRNRHQQTRSSNERKH